VTFAELGKVVTDVRLVTRAAIANYLLFPALAVVLLLAFEAVPMVAAGFLVLAVCPGAPFGPPLAGVARADVPQAVGLMVILAGSSAIVSPLLLTVLMPWLADESATRIDLVGMVGALLVTQLLPLLLGLLVKAATACRQADRPTRARQQNPQSRRHRPDPGDPVPDACRHPPARLRWHAAPARRQPPDRLARRRTEASEPQDHGPDDRAP
jgi:predicted Na+-dependent transporter